MTKFPLAAVMEAFADRVNPSVTVWVLLTELFTIPSAPIVRLLPVRVLSPALKVIPLSAVTQASFVTAAEKPGLLKVRFEPLVIPIVLKFPDPLVQTLAASTLVSTAPPTHALTASKTSGATPTRPLSGRRKAPSRPNRKTAEEERESME